HTIEEYNQRSVRDLKLPSSTVKNRIRSCRKKKNRIMKSFNVPVHYRSPLITPIKQKRKSADRMKKDFNPTHLRLGDLEIILARHFGFCYGVENAIEIAFRAVEENKGKRIFLLSEMIHNPGVNADLQACGVRFLMDTKGNKI